ncbi:UNVERIFIED_CONTAM: hypothetical protein Sradi_4136800 [Sesamum radiatum]|uniref:Uncharacterized protein n=1 Tax=Sesamum radiatum TaxID=300843 RepID=A0AAW2P2Y0_SESRA
MSLHNLQRLPLQIMPCNFAMKFRCEEIRNCRIFYNENIITKSLQNFGKKLALSLIVAARKLRPYFQSHQVTVLTNQPLKHILVSPNASGRIEARPAIKAQAIADFISEVTGNEDSTRSQEWEIFVDGSLGIVSRAILEASRLIHAAGARKVRVYGDFQ